MRYYSTNGAASEVTLKEAIIKGLAPDKGLYMPESIKTLPAAFLKYRRLVAPGNRLCGGRFAFRRRCRC